MNLRLTQPVATLTYPTVGMANPALKTVNALLGALFAGMHLSRQMRIASVLSVRVNHAGMEIKETPTLVRVRSVLMSRVGMAVKEVNSVIVLNSVQSVGMVLNPQPLSVSVLSVQKICAGMAVREVSSVSVPVVMERFVGTGNLEMLIVNAKSALIGAGMALNQISTIIVLAVTVQLTRSVGTVRLPNSKMAVNALTAPTLSVVTAYLATLTPVSVTSARRLSAGTAPFQT